MYFLSILLTKFYFTHILSSLTASGDVTTLAGSGSETYADGIGRAASFYKPTCVAVSRDGGKLFVADQANYRIRLIDIGELLSTYQCPFIE